jgi:hypothetical protein
MGVTINADLLLDCLPQFLNQMEAVSYLAGLRRALSRCLSIQTTAISAHDLDCRTLLQPRSCALDAAVFQNIDNRMTLNSDIFEKRIHRAITKDYIIFAKIV